MFRFLCILFLFLFVVSVEGDDQIEDLETLLNVLKNSGTNARVGFLTGSNYISVKRILPSNTKPIIVTHKEDLIQMVLNGSLTAGLVSGIPDEKFHKSLHIFSSSIITMHSILMAPEWSPSQPYGLNGTLSTKHLATAIDAVVTKMQSKGIDDQLALKNSPKELVHAHTCKDDTGSQFQLPNRKDAEGLLKDILDSRKLKVLAMGPYNWGDTDGNYLANPPTGFYPDYLTEVVNQLKNLSGPDNVKYGEIQIERVNTMDASFPWYKLFDGSTHLTEPYFILDADYSGSGKPCQTDDDCLNADLPSGKETCRSARTCYHPPRTRVSFLRSSCTTVGTDSKFFTKRYDTRTIVEKSKSTSLDGGIIALIVILVFVCSIMIAFVGLLFYRKLLDKSTFSKLF